MQSGVRAVLGNREVHGTSKWTQMEPETESPLPQQPKSIQLMLLLPSPHPRPSLTLSAPKNDRERPPHLVQQRIVLFIVAF